MTAIAAAYVAYRLPVLDAIPCSPGGSDFSVLVHQKLQADRLDRLKVASTLQSQTFQLLERILRECSGKGWDGYSAKPISSAVCERAAKFLEALPSWMPIPDVIPETDGEISIDWYVSPEWIFSISVGEDGPIHFAGRFGQNRERHGTEAFDCSISSEIFDYIGQIARRYSAA